MGFLCQFRVGMLRVGVLVVVKVEWDSHDKRRLGNLLSSAGWLVVMQLFENKPKACFYLCRL
jgi:hypothetical protein